MECCSARQICLGNRIGKWVHDVYVKQEYWWNHVPKYIGSWYWKQICAIKKIMMYFIANQFQQMHLYSIQIVTKS